MRDLFKPYRQARRSSRTEVRVCALTLLSISFSAAIVLLPCGVTPLFAQAATDAPLVIRAVEDPKDFVSALYRLYFQDGSDAFLATAQGRKLCLSRSLAALWAASDAHAPPNGDVGAIDFDLMASTNGLELAHFDATTARADGTVAEVKVELTYKEPYVHEEPPSIHNGRALVTYRLIREGGRWRIDDLSGANWTLRGLLEASLK